MSTARIEALLRESKKDIIPVPRLGIKDIREDALSKRLRRFDNDKITMSNSNGIYINTNEHEVKATAVTLSQLPLIDHSCHIGFSGWHNFDIMAQRNSSRGIICDLNPENALFLSLVLFNIRQCNSRFEFIDKISHFINTNRYDGLRSNKDREPWLGTVNALSIKFSLNVSEEPPYSQHYSIKEEVPLELKRETSWLYTDARYEYIRKLALSDKIALITEDICKTDTFAGIAQMLKENMIQIDTVYVSNIAEWVDSEDDRAAFYKTTQLFLSDHDTILIDGRCLSLDVPIPSQRCITARELSYSSLATWFHFKKTPVEPICDLPHAECLPNLGSLSMQ